MPSKATQKNPRHVTLHWQNFDRTLSVGKYASISNITQSMNGDIFDQKLYAVLFKPLDLAVMNHILLCLNYELYISGIV